MKHLTNIDIKVESGDMVPFRKSMCDAGFDLKANIVEDEEIIIKPGEIKLISTGVKVDLPKGYEAQIRPRSGLALKHGISIVNSPGTIDCNYRGDIGIIIINHGNEAFTITRGMRIAQMVITELPTVELICVDELSDSDRGSKGFGSSGV